MIAVVSLLFAQACAGFLPPPDHQLEWFRNGERYAIDAPVSASDGQITYRRTYANGTRATTRVLSCTSTHLVDRVGESQVRIPISLASGRTQQVDGATVRRIPPPQRTTPGALWFSVAQNDTRLYGLRKGIGVEQVRTPSPAGIEILHAVPRSAPVLPDSTSQGEGAELMLRRAQRYLDDQIRANDALRDSLALVASRTNTRLSRITDSIQAVLASERAGRAWVTTAAARIVADSALRLPSEDAARQSALIWPGAGHFALGRGGVGWGIAGIGAATLVGAGALLPDRGFRSLGMDTGTARPALVVGGTLSYLATLALSRSNLNGLLEQERAAYRTREAFLQHAQVELSPTGTLLIRFTTQER